MFYVHVTIKKKKVRFASAVRVNAKLASFFSVIVLTKGFF